MCLCAIGLHRWKPHYRALLRPRIEPGLRVVAVIGFTPILGKAPYSVTRTTQYICDRCTRCGKRRPA